MDKDYILKVKGLYHQFLLGNNKTLQVLKNVSLSASRGEFISILGISGSGKSTLLKCISSLLEPTSGEVILNGINPYKIRNAKLSSIRRNEVSFIFQAYNLIPSLPVIENIALPLRLSQKKLTIKNVENL
ncbi:ATP-binding cassette domain-containing protein, partial [Streptococcus pneumoniae]